MKRKLCVLITIALLATGAIGCSKSFWGGAAVGAAGAGAAYELQKKKQMDRLEEDFEQGRISREEYLERKKEIQEGSIIY
ncbi:MAG: hypothetical protein K9M82_00725 [Deltaproteobacteria bacterium]|nr:hypothetical protein [Deltaproteobacteria bacterium]